MCARVYLLRPSTSSLGAGYRMGWVSGKGAILDEQITKVEAFCARLKKHPERTGLYFVIALIVIIMGTFGKAYFSEKGRQFASTDKPKVKAPKPDATFFEEGWVTYHRFQLNKERSIPLEVGSCPSKDCYRFSLGPRETRDNIQVQTIFLEGEGFEKHLEKMPGGGFQLFRLAQLESKGGSYSLPVREGHITANLGLFKGASLRLRAIDNDVLFVVEDDRINNLTVGVAIYEGTYCNLQGR